MSIRKRTLIANFILLLLPTLLIFGYFRTFISISNVPRVVINLFLFSSITVITVNVLITIYMIRSITEPINKLIFATKEIKKGNLDYIINYDAKDEFYDVIYEFDQMRAALKKSREEVEYFNEEKKQMTASIVHDLKTPIATILGYSQGILDNVANTEEKKTLYIKTIYEKTRHIDKLVDNLFLLSSLENEILSFEFGSISIGRIEKYFYNIKEDLNESGIYSKIDIKCDRDLEIFIDKTQMERVVQNLIENSIKYKRDEELFIKFDVWENEGRVIFKMSDNGIGIDRSQEERIFERFYRSDIARSSKDGSGLGLTTVKHIVEGQKGYIWARKNGDKGLSIYISFLKGGKL